MFRFFSLIALFLFPVSTVQAESPRYCKTSFASGGKIETRFMGLSYQMLMYALAEKHCGAKPSPMGPKFLGYLERQGCDAKTEIYQDVAASISRFEGWNLKLMATEGDPSSSITEQQARDWAKNASEQLGGCESLLKLHDGDPKTWK